MFFFDFFWFSMLSKPGLGKSSRIPWGFPRCVQRSPAKGFKQVSSIFLQCVYTLGFFKGFMRFHGGSYLPEPKKTQT